jgi:hypothetical protein
VSIYIRPDTLCQDPVQELEHQDAGDTDDTGDKREVTFAAHGAYRKIKTAEPIKVLPF